jgi:hypothetical protein
MAETNAPVLDTLVQMNNGVLERSGLEEETFMLVRIAALASSGAPPASYLVNLGAASELGLSLEQVQGVLIAIAPVVGSARRWWAAPAWPAPGARSSGPLDSPLRSRRSRKWKRAPDRRPSSANRAKESKWKCEAQDESCLPRSCS